MTLECFRVMRVDTIKQKILEVCLPILKPNLYLYIYVYMYRLAVLAAVPREYSI